MSMNGHWGSLCHHACKFVLLPVKLLYLHVKEQWHITDNLYLVSLDDEEALNSIMKDLAALGRCYTQHNKPKNRTLLYKQVSVQTSCDMASVDVKYYWHMDCQQILVMLWSKLFTATFQACLALPCLPRVLVSCFG